MGGKSMGLALYPILYSGEKQFIMIHFVLRIVTFVLSHSSMPGYVIDPWKYVVNCRLHFSICFLTRYFCLQNTCEEM